MGWNTPSTIRRTALCLAVSLAVLVGSTSTLAHPRAQVHGQATPVRLVPAAVDQDLAGPAVTPPQPLLAWQSDGATLPDVGGLLALGFAVAGLGLGRRQRIAVALVVVALVVLGAETAVHSVHHLHDPGAAANCATWGVSQHLVGASWLAAPTCPGPAAVQRHGAPESLRGYPHAAVTWLELGRAPPPSTSGA